MNILVVSSNFYPDVFAINDLVEKLVQRGHQVTVFTGLPDYSTSMIPEEYKHKRNRMQSYKGAKVIRVSTLPRRHGPVFRSLNYLSFWINGEWYVKHKKWHMKYDVVYVWEVSPVTQLFPAIAFGKRFGIPVYVYCMDIWPECVQAMGISNRSLLFKLIHCLSRKAYRSVDHIAISSQPFMKYLELVNGVDVKKISYLPQYGPQWMLEQNYYKAPNKIISFLYIGNIGKATRLEVLIKAVAIVRKSLKAAAFNVVIAGNGTDRDNCKQLSEKLKLENVIHFIGIVPFEETGVLYKAADCCVFTLDGSNHIGDTLPGKVQTYMAAGKPIIASCNGAGNEVIKESHCGIAVRANDEKALAEALIRFISNPKDFSSCGNNARDYFQEHFLEEKHLVQLEDEIKNLVRNERKG